MRTQLRARSRVEILQGSGVKYERAQEHVKACQATIARDASNVARVIVRRSIRSGVARIHRVARSCDDASRDTMHDALRRQRSTAYVRNATQSDRRTRATRATSRCVTRACRATSRQCRRCRSCACVACVVDDVRMITHARARVNTNPMCFMYYTYSLLYIEYYMIDLFIAMYHTY